MINAIIMIILKDLYASANCASTSLARPTSAWWASLASKFDIDADIDIAIGEQGHLNNKQS